MPSGFLFWVAVVLLFAGETSCTVFGPAGIPQQYLYDRTSSRDNSWHKYVRAPSSRTVSPKGIVQGSISGNVSNPSGLIDGEHPTILTRQTTADSIPSLVVDFGQNLAGYLNLDLADVANLTTPLPGLRLAFSETLEYLTGSSDFTRSYNADSGDKANKVVPRGTDQVAVKSGSYTWTDSLGCQHDSKVCADGLHGFRYVRIWLEALPEDTPYTSSLGQVAISSVSLTYSGFLGTPDTFTGWFECSDEDLTQWWYDGVYTTELCTDVFRADDSDPRQAASPSLEGKLVIHDGAKRDRDPYVGDLTVSALTSYLSHNVPEAARNVLADLADHQRPDGWIPPASIRGYSLPLFDYPLHWVVCSYNLVLYTGDLDYLRKYYPVLVKALDSFYPSVTDPATSLLSKGLAGTAGYGDYAFLPRNGSITYYNALYVMALNRAAELAGMLSTDSVDASRWRARASAVAASLLKHNWDPAVGAFFDGGPCPGHTSDLMCPTHPQDGNSIAILAGVTASANNSNSNNGNGTEPLSESILAYLSSATSLPHGNAFFDNDLLLPPAPGANLFSNRVYAYTSFFELAARLSSPSAQTISSGLDQLRRTYGWMAAANNDSDGAGGGGTFWEGAAGPDGAPYEAAYTSMAHGWASGVTPLLTRFVLGVRPLAPGFGVWAVRPVGVGGGGAGVGWARGVVPTPGGPIEVRWGVGGSGGGRVGGSFEMSVRAPPGTKGEVSVPVDGEGARVYVDGEVAYDGGPVGGGSAAAVYRDRYVVVQVAGGNHTFGVE